MNLSPQIIEHTHTHKTQHMVLEIHDLAWNRHKNGLNWFMGLFFS